MDTQLPDDDVVVSKEINEYLDQIEIERQRKIDEEQRRWYEMKWRNQGDSMRSEFPSTPREAFESANEGLYYGAQISKLRADGGICKCLTMILGCSHRLGYWDT